MRAQVTEKDDVLEFVDREITMIKKKQAEDSRQMESKDAMLFEMRVLNEELRVGLATKTEEIKMLIDRIESLKRQKDQELMNATGR